MIETLNAYDEVIQKTSNLVRTLKIYPKVFEEEKHKYLHQFFDRVLYNTLSQLDLIIGLKYLDLSQAVSNQLEANYFARIVAHSSFEILTNLNKLVGKGIRSFVIDKVGKSELENIDNSVKELNKFKKEHHEKLKTIRHNLIGHKLKEGHKQAELIVNIDNREIYDIGNKIFKVQNKLIGYFTELIEKL